MYWLNVSRSLSGLWLHPNGDNNKPKVDYSLITSRNDLDKYTIIGLYSPYGKDHIKGWIKENIDLVYKLARRKGEDEETSN